MHILEQQDNTCRFEVEARMVCGHTSTFESRGQSSLLCVFDIVLESCSHDHCGVLRMVSGSICSKERPSLRGSFQRILCFARLAGLEGGRNEVVFICDHMVWSERMHIAVEDNQNKSTREGYGRIASSSTLH